MSHPAEEPRACLRCFCVKAAEGFPSLGLIDSRYHRKRRGTGPPQVPGVTRVCMACIEREAWALHDAGYLPHVRREWTRKGVRMRFCIKCRKGKAVERFPDVKGVKTRTCRDCRKVLIRGAKQAQLQREGDAVRERQARLARERRKRSPDARRKEREARQRWREKMKADPRRHAEHLEADRLRRRMKKDEEGKGPGKPAPGRMVPSGALPRVPAGPLVAYFDKRYEQLQAVEGVLEEGKTTVKQFALDLGTDERTIRRWREEDGNITIALAEKVLLGLGVEWHEVYSYDDHAEAFLAVEVEA